MRQQESGSKFVYISPNHTIWYWSRLPPAWLILAVKVLEHRHCCNARRLAWTIQSDIRGSDLPRNDERHSETTWYDVASDDVLSDLCTIMTMITMIKMVATMRVVVMIIVALALEILVAAESIMHRNNRNDGNMNNGHRHYKR